MLHVQSFILSGKNILQVLPSRELMTMRHVSFIKNLDNLDAYLYSDRQSSNFLTLEIQSNLNFGWNGSYAAKSIECRTFSFIKKDNPVLTLPCFSLVFWKESEPYRAFYLRKMQFLFFVDGHSMFQDGHCNLFGPGQWGFIVKNGNLVQLKNILKRNMRKNLKQKNLS